jgi:hypothetical protein
MELMSLSVDFVKQSHLPLLHSSPRSFIAGLRTRPSDVHDGTRVLLVLFRVAHSCKAAYKYHRVSD